MEGVLAVILVFSVPGLVALAFSPVGRALADRWRHGVQPLPPSDSSSELWLELERLNAEVDDLSERLAFAERLLHSPGTAEAAKPMTLK